MKKRKKTKLKKDKKFFTWPPDQTTSFIVYLYVVTKSTHDSAGPDSDHPNSEGVNTADLLKGVSQISHFLAKFSKFQKAMKK